MPNMPLFLWGDRDCVRNQDSYFDVYPGVWQHGDWLRIEGDGSCEIFSRSDATINRGGHLIACRARLRLSKTARPGMSSA